MVLNGSFASLVHLLPSSFIGEASCSAVSEHLESLTLVVEKQLEECQEMVALFMVAEAGVFGWDCRVYWMMLSDCNDERFYETVL